MYTRMQHHVIDTTARIKLEEQYQVIYMITTRIRDDKKHHVVDMSTTRVDMIGLVDCMSI